VLLRMIYDEELAQAAYLLGCEASGEAIVVDPQRDVDRYIDLAEANALRIRTVAETHVHADFVSGARELAERTGATVCVSGAGGPDWTPAWLDSKSGGGSYDHRLLAEGDVIRIGSIELKAMHTPGHTPEHMAYLVTDTAAARSPLGILSGDFVFVGDLGRPDLLESAAGYASVAAPAARELAASARRLADQPDHLQIWPGHGAGSACGKALGAVPQSTLGYERLVNPGLRLAADDDAFAEYALGGQPEPPRYFGRMKRVNIEGPPVLGGLPIPRRLENHQLTALHTTTAVVDCRRWADFRERHIPGALFSPLGKSFHTFAGSYLEPGEDIVLIVPERRLEHAVRSLVRIGFDRVTGWAPPQAIESLPASELQSAPEISAERMAELQESGSPSVLDVRRAVEHAAGAIPRALNIAHTRLAERMDELTPGETVYVHCRSGVRSAAACSLLLKRGFDAVNIAGGMLAWQQLARERV